MLTFNGPSALLYLPDEAISSTFEVVMPSLDLSKVNGVHELESDKSNNKKSTWDKITDFIKDTSSKLLTNRYYTPIVEGINLQLLQTFKTDTTRIRDLYKTVPVDQEKLSDVKITFFCSSAMTIYYYLACWHNLIYDRKFECYNSPKDYKRDILVYYYGHDDLATAQFTLEGCFPKNLHGLNLSYSDPKRITLECDFNVDRITQNDNVKTVAITKEYAAHIAPNVAQNLIPGIDGSSISGAIREIFN